MLLPGGRRPRLLELERWGLLEGETVFSSIVFSVVCCYESDAALSVLRSLPQQRNGGGGGGGGRGGGRGVEGKFPTDCFAERYVKKKKKKKKNAE